jgi:hypothetical protein
MCWPLTRRLNAADSAGRGVDGSVKLLETNDKF